MRNLYHLDYDTTAHALYDTTTTLYRQAGDRAGGASACLGLGDVALATGNYPGAAESYRAAQDIFTEIGNRAGEAIALWGMGEVALATGDCPTAIQHFRASQKTCTEIGSRAGEADACLGLGAVALTTGDYPRATESYRAAGQRQALFLGQPHQLGRGLLLGRFPHPTNHSESRSGVEGRAISQSEGGRSKS